MDSTERVHSPSIRETAFDCPHCGAFTTQCWYYLYASQIDEDRRVPLIVDDGFIAGIMNEPTLEDETRQAVLEFAHRAVTGFVQIESESQDRVYLDKRLHNLNISRCYNCKKVSVWRYTCLIYPSKKVGPTPNQDLPQDIQGDFEEARSIVGESPRGAAALLRLCVQKVCAHLGESGKDIDKDIASLVAKGLNPTIQKCLDIVRVIGNEAVHPGVIDLRDDCGIALELFGLVNVIADQMISQPKKVEELYEALPDSKKQHIEHRNGKAKKA